MFFKLVKSFYFKPRHIFPKPSKKSDPLIFR